uniref:Acyl-coenzyme A thioesterase 13 n=1 Tax=Meloidogyne incognita TaxID=6306 RepID=A0A914M8N2_MELIC
MYALSKNFQRCAEKCRVVEVEEGRVKVEMEVEEKHTNPFGTLHGGMTATLVDIVTTTALMATPQGKAGVTVDLTINLFLGESILIDAWVTKLGRSLSYTSADVYRKVDNTKIATALHTKAFPIMKN